ncbi:hypothetical protein [Streptomyces ipomoeae]|uniref:hypothetical protein n=1 Tax=Streptomyces ipomoeae TaxID=103232 RepID=UPI0011475F08|nr:hypothetical protein [Streptomyces ipomoeae]MDX2935638.1 hypothetical protein [Streptomyces ipomoeae]TQE15467.1 hypothetical protein SipoB123_43460 [Streptomyces ipomoeae]
MANEPDIAFGLHLNLGTMAAVSDVLPQAEAALPAAGFEHALRAVHRLGYRGCSYGWWRRNAEYKEAG